MSRILFTDDDQMMLRMAGFIMKKTGNEAITASSGEEGLSKLKSEQPDMVFIDIEMPGMSGLEMLARIRQDSSVASVPVCLMSGTVTDEIKAQASELGAVNVIGKPLQAAEVSAVIASAL